MEHDEVLRLGVLRDLEREPMGVYEVWYAANTLFPEWLVSDRVAVAERVFAQLVKDGTVRLWRGRSIGPEFDRTPVTDREVDQILRSFSTWAPEAGEPLVWMELRPSTGSE